MEEAPPSPQKFAEDTLDPPLAADEVEALPQVLVVLAGEGGRAPRKAVFDRLLEEGVAADARLLVEKRLLHVLVGDGAVKLEAAGPDELLVLEKAGVVLVARLAATFLARKAEAGSPVRDEERRPKCKRCRRRVDELRSTVVFLPGVGADPNLRAFPLAGTIGCPDCRRTLGYQARVYGVPFPEGSTEGNQAAGGALVDALRAEADRLVAVVKGG